MIVTSLFLEMDYINMHVPLDLLLNEITPCCVAILSAYLIAIISGILRDRTIYD